MANYISNLIYKCVFYKGSKHNVLKHVNQFLNLNRQYSSALFVSSSKGKDFFSFVTPYLDFDERLKDLDRLQAVLTDRKLNVDATDIKKMWEFYKAVKADKSRLEVKSEEITTKLNPFFQKKELTTTEETEFTKLKVQIKAVKNDLKIIRDALHDLNESIMVKMLQLPNNIDSRTPSQLPIVLKRVNSVNKLSDPTLQNHIEIGRRLGLLEYKNPMQYYLCNDAALFELGVLNYAGRIFTAENMIRIAGADFSRSVVIEGSGLNHEDPADAFIIDNHSEVDTDTVNRMHLVGGASLISFLALHTKQLINPNHFPVAYFSTGRQYTPFRSGCAPIGLFTVSQASAVVAFMLVKDLNSSEYQVQFERLLDTVCKLYDSVCDHYQIVMRPASELKPWETMRVSFELWSSFIKQYIEVGHISLCGEYFSKRLMIAYQSEKGQAFPSVISGTVLSVPRLLGCLLEQNPEKFVIPPKILEHSPINYTSPQD